MRLGVYMHYKGNVYEVIAVGTQENTGEKLVVYVSAKGKVWLRPLKQFNETILLPDGKKTKRFKFLI